MLLLSLLDLPFSISPVVTGLMLMLLYGRAGWFAQFLAENGINIVFAFPGKGGICNILFYTCVVLGRLLAQVVPTTSGLDLCSSTCIPEHSLAHAGCAACILDGLLPHD